jgi:hypothetical protein
MLVSFNFQFWYAPDLVLGFPLREDPGSSFGKVGFRRHNRATLEGVTKPNLEVDLRLLPTTRVQYADCSRSGCPLGKKEEPPEVVAQISIRTQARAQHLLIRVRL